MEEKYEQFKEELLNDPGFIYDTNISKGGTYTTIKNKVSSLDIITRVAFPSVVIGYTIALAQNVDGFLKTVLFLVAMAAMVISYVSYQTACDKLVDDTFYYEDLPQKIKKDIRYRREKKLNDILSEIRSASDDSIAIIESIRYRKAIPKDSWDELYKSLLKISKLHRQYKELSSDFDHFERQVPKDYLLISSIKDRIKK